MHKTPLEIDNDVQLFNKINLVSNEEDIVCIFNTSYLIIYKHKYKRSFMNQHNFTFPNFFAYWTGPCCFGLSLPYLKILKDFCDTIRDPN